jgi:predicted HD superfamily hydrolase involved in NAD metabolism
MDYTDRRLENLTPEKKEHINQLAARMKKLMKPSLFEHSLGTLEFAMDMADSSGEDVDLYRLAVSAIVHDYGKIFCSSELKEAALSHKPGLSGVELQLKPLLHSLIGDFLVSRDLGIKDKMILRAVKIHTIGSPAMSLEEKILFIADKVERTRKYEGIEALRLLALKDINLCLIEVYKNNIIYVINKNKLLHPDTSRIWNSICGGN